MFPEKLPHQNENVVLDFSWNSKTGEVTEITNGQDDSNNLYGRCCGPGNCFHLQNSKQMDIIFLPQIQADEDSNDGGQDEKNSDDIFEIQGQGNDDRNEEKIRHLLSELVSLESKSAVSDKNYQESLSKVNEKWSVLLQDKMDKLREQAHKQAEQQVKSAKENETKLLVEMQKRFG
eukprot:UN28529